MKVDFEDRKYWKTQKCNNLIKPADLLAKSTSDVLCNFVFIFHWDDGVISMNFYPIWPVIHARSNFKFDWAWNTGQIGWKFIENTLYASLVKLGIIPMNSTGIYLNGFTPNSTSRIWPGMKYWSKMDGNSLRIHCMPPWSNWVSSQWIQLASISMDLLQILPVEFDRAWNTGQIGLKFTEITLYASLVELGIIPMNSTGIYLNGFTPNSTSQIWPGMKYWSNWVEIHWDHIVCLPGWIGYHPNEFNWHLSQWI